MVWEYMKEADFGNLENNVLEDLDIVIAVISEP